MVQRSKSVQKKIIFYIILYLILIFHSCRSRNQELIQNNKNSKIDVNQIMPILYGKWHVIRCKILIKNTENQITYNFSDSKLIDVRQDSIFIDFKQNCIFNVNQKKYGKWIVKSSKNILTFNCINNPKVFFDFKNQYQIDFINKNFVHLKSYFNENNSVVEFTYFLVRKKSQSFRF